MFEEEHVWEEKRFGFDKVPALERYIDDLLGPGGVFEKKVQGYTPRQGQIDMARAVDNVLRRSGKLFAEGPTGTGKSLAYCIPAAYHAVRVGSPALIVTANIALQEQLVTKDLPLLRKVATWPFTYGLLKGKNNYICQRELSKTNSQMREKRRLPTLSGEENAQLLKILNWELASAHGDKSELDFDPSPRVWRKVSVGHEECIGSECNVLKDCYSVRARDRVKGVDVLVINYWMLYVNILAGGKILPSYGYLILDEAHKAVDIARDFFGEEVTRGAIQSVLDPLSSDTRVTPVVVSNNNFFHQLDQLYKSRGYSRRLKVPKAVDYTDLTDGLRVTADLYLKRQELIDTEFKMMGKDADAEVYSAMAAKKAEAAEYSVKADKARELAAALESMMTLSNPNAVVYIESRGAGKPPVLKSKPIELGGMIYSSLLSGIGVVMTSATLSDGNSFNYISEEFGISEPECFVAQSPFEWDKQAYLIVDESMPLPQAKEQYKSAVCSRLVEIIKMTRGRVLALFTSYEVLHYAYEYVCRHLPDFVIYRQGQMPRIKLIEAFQQNTESCLFGTESFWAGVDVPGESLSCVVMDRLPFQNPDDPVLDYLTDVYDDWFFRFSLPKAVIQFRQGFGRLIRSTTDRGVVVVLDPRILKKGYGKRFLASLPRVHMSTNLGDIAKVLPTKV